MPLSSPTSLRIPLRRRERTGSLGLPHPGESRDHYKTRVMAGLRALGFHQHVQSSICSSAAPRPFVAGR